jgi:hypothetical protein
MLQLKSALLSYFLWLAFASLTGPLWSQQLTADTSIGSHLIEARDRSNGWDIYVGELKLAEWTHRDTKILRPFFSNVKTIKGLQVTRNHPPIAQVDALDHADMHPGVWLGFGELSGEDFWRNKADMVFVRVLRSPSNENGILRFSVEHSLQRGSSDPPANRSIGIVQNNIAIEREADHWAIDWNMTFYATDSDLTFGDQEEMGLGVRVAASMTEKNMGVILNSAGSRTAKQSWGQEADWCNYGGVLDGQPSGIMVIPHRANFRKSWWHNRDYGLMVANAFGRQAMKQGDKSLQRIEKGHSFSIGYRIVFHQASSSIEELRLIADKWSN